MMRRAREERGSISIWMVTASFVMMVLVGLAVDLGGQVHAKQRAHNIAAEAARTGGEQVEAAPQSRAATSASTPPPHAPLLSTTSQRPA